jgi:hypothetical protein
VIKEPDIFTRYNQVFAENLTLKSQLAICDRRIAELNQIIEVALQGLDELAPDSILTYCIRLQLEGKVDFVIKVPNLSKQE